MNNRLKLQNQIVTGISKNPYQNTFSMDIDKLLIGISGLA